MNLTEFRQWLFDIIAVILPGVAAVIVIGVFLLSPRDFVLSISNARQVERVALPFRLYPVNVAYLLGLAFICGHLMQQVSVHLLKLHARVFRLQHDNMIEQVFSLPQVREYLLPRKAGITSMADALTNNDYFMIVYPECAPPTKRDTFIAISGFCGSMAVVSIIVLVLSSVEWIMSLATHRRLPLEVVLPMVVASGIATTLWIDRCRFFHDMADRVVVANFLARYGSHYRAQSDLILVECDTSLRK